jgi:hypothetical protein
LALAAGGVLALAAPARANLYVVGVGAGCSHATVQAAVDDSALTSEADTILVARNTTYNNQDISIDDQSLTIIGGLPNCTNFLSDGRTVLSGSGGAAAPVISIRGTGNVSISRINLSGGDEGDDDLGGGLFFHGSGIVRLADMNIFNNRAGAGGGIYARGTSDTAELVIGANVLISNNTAVRNGGGIDAVDIRLTMTSPGSAIFQNTATGRVVNGQFFDGDGGGIQCLDCRAVIGTATALGTIFLNTAYGRGGGVAIFADGRDTHVNLYTKTATLPLIVWGNAAGLQGGGFYAEAEHESLPPAFYGASIQAWDIVVRDNVASAGAAVFLRGDDDFTGDALSSFVMGDGRPAGAVACAPASGPCNRITGNVAQDLEGVPANGAILEGATGRTRFELRHAVVDDNVGRAVIRKSTSHYTWLRRSLLAGNTVSEELIQHLDSFPFVLDHCTIAGNQIGGSHVIRAGRDTRIGHSIVWQPGKKVLRRDDSGGELILANLLVNDLDGLPPQVDILTAATPGFVSTLTPDYRLRADSVAVDFAQYAFDAVWDLPEDLDWRSPEVDLAEVPDEFGPRDLGAYELQAYPDVIFADGFESGNLAAWSAFSADSGDLSASPVSAMEGSWGLRGVVDDTAGIYVQDDSPIGEVRYRARFTFDPNGFDPGEAAGKRRTRILLAFTEAPLRRVLAVVLRRINGQFSLMGRARLDDNTQADTTFVPIADGPHTIEIDWRRASGPDAQDGWFTMYIDGSFAGHLAGLDNSLGGVDFARLGALSVKTGASGTMHWDAFESRRQTYIGPVP